MAMPIGITCAMIYFVRHCPRWAGLFSVVSGMLYSVVTQHGRIVGIDGCSFCAVLDKTGITGAVTAVSRWMGVENFNIHEPWPLQMQVLGMVLVCVSTYLFAGLFHKKESAAKKALTNAFYEKMDRPVDFETEVGGSEDMRQLIIIGILAMIIGSGICLLAFFADSLSGIVSCLGVGGVVLVVGIIFYRLGLKSKAKLAE